MDTKDFDQVDREVPDPPQRPRRADRHPRRPKSTIGRMWYDRRHPSDKAELAEPQDDDVVDVPPSPGENDDRRTYRRTTTISAVAALVGLLVIIGLLWATARNNPYHQPGTETAAASETTKSPIPSVPRWKRNDQDHGNNRWVKEGLPSIEHAKTKAQARKAAQDWVNQVKTDPILFKAAAQRILNKNVDKDALFRKDGWASDEAVNLAAEMQVELAMASITPDDAPADGVNTGVDGGKVVSSRHSGITGNRKAVRIQLRNGDVFWVMRRCSNVVTKVPVFPPGKTEHQPKPRPRPRPKPYLKPKDPSQDPWPRGKAPQGGGPNADPGPGKYIPPDQMERPPSTPRVNPAPPVSPDPPRGSTPDPAPAPKPEEKAPPPTTPETGNGTPPGGGSI